jgi:hypothetical protein
MFCKHETEREYAFLANAIKTEMGNLGISPKFKYSMSDFAPQIYNGMRQVFGDDLVALKCYAHLTRVSF